MESGENRTMRLLPGSLDERGRVIDYQGKPHDVGPCFVPADIPPARKGLMGAAGWCIAPATIWPSVLPRHGLGCIYRPK